MRQEQCSRWSHSTQLLATTSLQYVVRDLWMQVAHCWDCQEVQVTCVSLTYWRRLSDHPQINDLSCPSGSQVGSDNMARHEDLGHGPVNAVTKFPCNTRGRLRTRSPCPQATNAALAACKDGGFLRARSGKKRTGVQTDPRVVVPTRRLLLSTTMHGMASFASGRSHQKGPTCIYTLLVFESSRDVRRTRYIRYYSWYWLQVS